MKNARAVPAPQMRSWVVVDEQDAAEFLSCDECQRVFGPGHPYVSQPTAVEADGSAWLRVLCVYCETPVPADWPVL